MRYNTLGTIFQNCWIEAQDATWDIDLNETGGYSRVSGVQFLNGHLSEYPNSLRVIFGNGAYYNTISQPTLQYSDIIGSLTDNGVGNKIVARDIVYPATYTQTKSLFVSITNSSWQSYLGSFSGAALPHGSVGDNTARGSFIVPSDYGNSSTVYVYLVANGGSGDVKFKAYCNYASDGQAYTTGATNYGSAVASLTSNNVKKVSLGTGLLNSALANQIASLSFERWGSDGSDTLTQTCMVIGFEIIYSATIPL